MKLLSQVDRWLIKIGLKETLGHSSNYFIKLFATKGVALISIPVFTYLMTPEEYGVLNIFAAYSSLAAVILTLNAQVGIGRYYFEKRTDFGEFLFSSIVFPSILLLIFFVLIAFNTNRISNWLNLPERTVIFLVPTAALAIVSGYILQIFRAKKESITVRNFSIKKVYISFIAGVLLVYVYTEDRYMGRLWANVAVLALFIPVAYSKIKPLVVPKVKMSHIKYMLTYSIPLLPAYLSGVLLSQIDRVIIGEYVGYKDAGLYSFAYNIGSLQSMVANAITYAWIADYYIFMNNKQFKEHDNRVIMLVKFIAIGTCGLIFFSKEIGIILGESEYHKALYLIPIIVVGQFFIAFASFYKNHISFTKKTIISSIVILAGAGLNVWLNILYIPVYGTIAGAYTTLVSYAFQAVLIMFSVKFVLKVHFTNPMRFIDSFVVIGVSISLFYFLEQGSMSEFAKFLLKLPALILLAAFLLRKNINYKLKEKSNV